MIEQKPSSFRNKGTKEIFKDAGSMVLDAQKRYGICLNLVYCDIECVVKDLDGDCWYILDECSNWDYFPHNEYEIIFTGEPTPERSQRLPPCPKCGAWTFSANIDAGYSLLCSNDACKWQQKIVAQGAQTPKKLRARSSPA